MPSKKIERINEAIMGRVSELIGQVKDPRVQQGIISITRVDTTADLRYSKIYVSVMGDKVDEAEFTRGIKSASGWLRRELGETLKLRYTPELLFELDKSIAYGAYINEIISGLNIVRDEEQPGDD